MNPKILLFGAGAIGSLYGGKLAQAGAKVSVVCRSDYDQIKAQGGYNIKSHWGDFSFTPELILKEASNYPGFPDLVMITSKVLPDIDFISLIKPVVGPNTGIFLIQNGIEIERPYLKAFPQNEIISCLAFVGVSRTAPGQIWHQLRGELRLGSMNHPESGKAALLKSLFNKAGVECELTSNIAKARWKKLVWNAPFNPISVLSGGKNTHQILANPMARELVIRVMEEVLALAMCTGNAIDPDFIDQQIQVTEEMAAYKTSMLLDFEAGRPLEIDAILGNAVAAADREGLEVPNLKALYGLLQLVASPP